MEENEKKELEELKKQLEEMKINMEASSSAITGLQEENKKLIDDLKETKALNMRLAAAVSTKPKMSFSDALAGAFGLKKEG